MYAIGSSSAKPSATELMALLSGGKHAARKLNRAQILLAADAGAGDEEIARSIGVGGPTVYRTKRRFVLGNLEAALSEEPRPGASRKLSGTRGDKRVSFVIGGSHEARAPCRMMIKSGMNIGRSWRIMLVSFLLANFPQPKLLP